MSDKAVAANETTAFRLLHLEQSEFERFLHDELGQCLVAIRSMAKAIDSDADREVAELIALAADEAYVEVYDRMMELRAESLAGEPGFGDAVRQCIDDLRLESRGLKHRLRLADEAEQLDDPVCRRLALRSLRCIAGMVKRLADCDEQLTVDIDRDGTGLCLSITLEPDGFPESFRDHAHLQRLERRLHECGGELLRQWQQMPAAIRVRLPGDGGS